MKEHIEVAAVEFAPDPRDGAVANARRMGETVERLAAERRTDLVVFPELADSAYPPRSFDADFATRLRRESHPVPGAVTDVLRRAARATGATIVAGVSERAGADLHNSAVVISGAGELVGTQRKVHLWTQERHYYRGGDRFDVFDTDIGRLGVSICYDSRFPESSRVQAIAGAEILVCLFALVADPEFSGERLLVHRAATRALENSAYYIACNRRGTEDAGEFFGGSVVAAPNGETSVGAGLVRSRLDRARLLRAREYADPRRDRRPEVYTSLVTAGHRL
ncbi:carbon-nitrogen hydrolase family protein [Pseudonocardia acaciae]|uniref:carbon-nitrogen hydrolase family protein n=1 Tax=Pseudonocardia acaciae TaxID=551276 RepID=UPI000688225E|nr:carbon-nitrogen hydrolase family protein [Pseudonocardia acaciae]